MTPTLNLNGLTTAQIQQLQTLADQFRATNEKKLETNPTIHNGKELISYWQQMEVINSLPKTLDSQQYARQLRHQAQTRNIGQF
ncbi:MAG: hypothetical protein AAGG51_25995 [Cyanobacteria bacterium P01_G01_bin.54]